MKIAANISLMFKERPFLQRFSAAKRAGFDGIEVQFPYDESPDALHRAATEAGLPVVLMNSPIIPRLYPAGMAGRPQMRAEFRSQLPKIAEYADALGVRFVHILAGPCAPAERGICRDTLVDNLMLSADALPTRQILIEFLNPHDAPGYLIGSLPDALQILACCDNRVRLQFDVYHAARCELSLAAELFRCLAMIDHVQFADAPGRHEPGTGTIRFGDVIPALLSSGYDGWLGAEYHPTGHTEAGLGWLVQWRQLAKLVSCRGSLASAL
jgi:hydroxypyruvate isomerase